MNAEQCFALCTSKEASQQIGRGRQPIFTARSHIVQRLKLTRECEGGSVHSFFRPMLTEHDLFSLRRAFRHSGHTAEGKADGSNALVSIKLNRERSAHSTDVLIVALGNFVALQMPM